MCAYVWKRVLFVDERKTRQKDEITGDSVKIDLTEQIVSRRGATSSGYFSDTGR